MTLTVKDAVQKAASKHRLIIQSRQVFFNTFDRDEVDEWVGHGAYARTWYTDKEIAATHARNPQGYEVTIYGACERMWITDEDGDEIDVTREALLAETRALHTRADAT